MRRIAAVALLLPGSYAALLGTLLAVADEGDTAPWVAAAGWAAVALAAVLARRAWPDVPFRNPLGLLTAAFAVSIPVMYLAWLVAYGVTIDVGLCGEGRTSGVAFA